MPLPRSERTLARHWHDVGYTTGLVANGIWAGTKFHPIRHGFDEFFGFTHEGHYFYRRRTGHDQLASLQGTARNARGRFTSADRKLIYSTHMGHDEPAYDANNPIVRGGQPVEEKAHLTDAFTREARDFIVRHQDKPFFLTSPTTPCIALAGR